MPCSIHHVPVKDHSSKNSSAAQIHLGEVVWGVQSWSVKGRSKAGKGRVNMAKTWYTIFSKN